MCLIMINSDCNGAVGIGNVAPSDAELQPKSRAAIEGGAAMAEDTQVTSPELEVQAMTFAFMFLHCLVTTVSGMGGTC